MIININETDKLKNDKLYQEFLNNNPGFSTLKIRTTSASEAFPVSGVLITLSKEIGSNTIIFYEGKTDESGMINGIKLPTSSKNTNDLEPPNFTTYKLRAVYKPGLFDKNYDISLCCGIGVVQYINITPRINPEVN